MTALFIGLAIGVGLSCAIRFGFLWGQAYERRTLLEKLKAKKEEG